MVLTRAGRRPTRSGVRDGREYSRIWPLKLVGPTGLTCRVGLDICILRAKRGRGGRRAT